MTSQAYSASRLKRTDAEKLQNEYEKLVAGLQQANEHREDEDMLSNPGRQIQNTLACI